MVDYAGKIIVFFNAFCFTVIFCQRKVFAGKPQIIIPVLINAVYNICFKRIPVMDKDPFCRIIPVEPVFRSNPYAIIAILEYIPHTVIAKACRIFNIISENFYLFFVFIIQNDSPHECTYPYPARIVLHQGFYILFLKTPERAIIKQVYKFTFFPVKNIYATGLGANPDISPAVLHKFPYLRIVKESFIVWCSLIMLKNLYVLVQITHPVSCTHPDIAFFVFKYSPYRIVAEAKRIIVIVLN